MGREVDAHVELVADHAALPPVLSLTGCLLEDLPAERDDQPGGFRNRDELKRGQQSPGRVVPTDEGFGTDEPARVGRDDRLVVDLELACCQTFPESDGPSPPAPRSVLSMACESRSRNRARLAKPVRVSWKAW